MERFFTEPKVLKSEGCLSKVAYLTFKKPIGGSKPFSMYLLVKLIIVLSTNLCV